MTEIVYSLYQLTCGYTVTTTEFKESLFELLKQYDTEKGICLTVNPGKYPCKGEPVAMIFVSVNPSRVPEGAAPHVQIFIGFRFAKSR
jgi:hypothetical protein